MLTNLAWWPLSLQGTPPRSAAVCPAGTRPQTGRRGQQNAAAQRQAATLGSAKRRYGAPSACERRSAPLPRQRACGQSHPGSSVQPRRGGPCLRCGSGCSSTRKSRPAAVAAGGREGRHSVAAWATAHRSCQWEGLLQGQVSGSGCQRQGTTMQMPVQRLQTLTAGCKACRTSCARPRQGRQLQCQHDGRHVGHPQAH